MERSGFVGRELDRIFSVWLVRVNILGALIFVSLGFLDYVVAREQFATLFLWRTTVSLFLLAVAAAVKLVPGRRVQRALALLAVLAAAATIERMILLLGGDRSIYAPGMMLLGVCVLGFVPASVAFHATAAAVIYLVYLVPILLAGPIADPAYFFAMNYFLLAVLGCALVLRVFFQRFLARDIGLRHDLARERERSEERFAAFMDNLPGVAVTRDAAGRYRYANRRFVELFGDPVGRTIEEVVPERAAEERRADAAVLAGELGVEASYATTGGGETRHWLDLGFPVGDLQDGPGLAAHIAVDVTDRRRMQERVGAAEQEWAEAFDSITDAITIHDLDYSIVRANRAARMLLGIPGLLPSAPRCFTLYHGTDCPPADCASCVSRATGEPSVSERYEPHLGRYVEIRAIPRHDAAGRPDGLIHIVRDISERKATEARLRTHLRQLEALRSIDRAISASFDLDLDLEIILNQVVTQLEVDAADVLLVNPHTLELQWAAGRGFLTTGVRGFSLRVGEGGPGLAAQERRLVHVADCASAPPVLCACSAALAGEGFVSAFFVPLLAKGQVQGVLEVFHRRPFAAGAEWLGFLETLAGQAAIAVDNARLFRDLQRSNLDLRLAYDTTIEGWSRALDYRDKETEGHSERVTELTVRVARRMGIGEEDLLHVRRGALLHDIGKLGVPDAILLKPGPLDEQEWALMRRHPVIARELLAPIPHLRQAIEIPYCHHERWDGSGYPRGLRGEQISLAVRVFSLVDFWDALTSARPYRAAWAPADVAAEARRLAGAHFDPEVVEAFLAIVAP